jgi:hypothetical protein
MPQGESIEESLPRKNNPRKNQPPQKEQAQNPTIEPLSFSQPHEERGTAASQLKNSQKNRP